jgi:predicted dehydrogenase
MGEGDSMRLGVIGGGYWGSKHVRVLEGLPDVDQLSLADPRAPVREALGRSFPRLRTFAGLDGLLPEVDAVVVATPPRTHHDLARRALDAGKHVLVEKPLATDAAQARQLVETADRSGLVLMSGHTFEFNAAVWWLREAVETRELGDPYFVDTARLNLGLYQPDVNVVWDLAPHDISILNYVLDSVPRTVEAWGRSHAHAYLEDVAYLRLEYEHPDVSARVHVSWLDPCKVRRVTLVGSQKMAVYNDLAVDERIRVYDKGLETGPGDRINGQGVSYRHNGMVSPSLPFREPLQLEDLHFVECVRSGRRPRSDGWSGLAVVEVLVAAEQSLRHGRPIEIERDALVPPAAAA